MAPQSCHECQKGTQASFGGDKIGLLLDVMTLETPRVLQRFEIEGGIAPTISCEWSLSSRNIKSKQNRLLFSSLWGFLMIILYFALIDIPLRLDNHDNYTFKLIPM